MKIILLVEGETETSLPPFFRGWLDPQLTKSVGIKTEKFKGVGDYRRRFAKSARLYLAAQDVAGVVGLIDFHNSGIIYPQGSLAEKCLSAKLELEAEVGDPRFRQHFAVHETEAWLLAQPDILPGEIQEAFKNMKEPERVNTNHPPSRRLNSAYQKHLGKKYGKKIEAARLFAKLDPAIAYAKCPHLKLLLDDVLALASAKV